MKSPFSRIRISSYLRGKALGYGRVCGERFTCITLEIIVSNASDRLIGTRFMMHHHVGQRCSQRMDGQTNFLHRTHQPTEQTDPAKCLVKLVPSVDSVPTEFHSHKASNGTPNETSQSNCALSTVKKYMTVATILRKLTSVTSQTNFNNTHKNTQKWQTRYRPQIQIGTFKYMASQCIVLYHRAYLKSLVHVLAHTWH